MIGRVGGIISLLVLSLKTVWEPLPIFILGIIPTIAGILASKFPETTGEGVPETMEQALNVGKDSKFKLFSCYNGVE